MKATFLTLTVLFSINAFSYSATQIAAWTLAQTVYATALVGATAEVSSNITSSTNQKAEAFKLQNDIQDYYQSETITPFLESKIIMAQKSLDNLSTEEAIDALLESTKIILSK